MCQGQEDHIYRYSFLLYYFERSIDILIFISLLFMLLAFMSFKLKIFNLFTGHLNWNINILFQMKYSQKPPTHPQKKKKKKRFQLLHYVDAVLNPHKICFPYISLNYSRNPRRCKHVVCCSLAEPVLPVRVFRTNRVFKAILILTLFYVSTVTLS